jgi:hypothetical protein
LLVVTTMQDDWMRGVAVEGKREERCGRCGLRGDDNGDDGVRVD